MPSAHADRPISAKPMTHGEAIVFAFAYSALVKAAEPHLAECELEALESIHTSVMTNLHLILTGEVKEESSEGLPCLSFLTHCGTTLADRYFKEMGLAIRDFFGAQMYERLRDDLASQLINL